MRRQLFLLLSLAVAASVHAQDVIVKKDGSTILSKVLEVNTTDIKYKKKSNINGPTYTISISDILSVNYENGEKETFENANANTSIVGDDANSSQKYIEKPADARNAEILAMHNRVYSTTKKLKEKSSSAKYWTYVLGVSSASIMSNDDIEMTFRREWHKKAHEDGAAGIVYCINLKNKTDKTIYIDKGNCFRIENNGSYLCYYEDREQTTINHSSGGGASLGLGSVAGALGVGGIAGQLAGGINVGRGSSHSVSTTYANQRIIAIPPHANRNLTEEKWVQLQKNTPFQFEKHHQVEGAERFEVLFKECGFSSDFINVGQTITYEEDEVPWKREYIITYSTEDNFRTYSSLKAQLYIHEAIGLPGSTLLNPPYYIDTRHKKEKNYIEGLDDYTITTDLCWHK